MEQGSVTNGEKLIAAAIVFHALLTSNKVVVDQRKEPDIVFEGILDMIEHIIFDRHM